MAEEGSYLSSLPVIPLFKIFSFLDKQDVAKCSQVCSRFNQVASTLPSWKKWCEDIWLVEECPPCITWKQLFSQWQMKWGRYQSCYATIKRAWTVIEEFTRLHCPAIYASLNDGLSEEELNETEVNKLNGEYRTLSNQTHPNHRICVNDASTMLTTVPYHTLVDVKYWCINIPHL